MIESSPWFKLVLAVLATWRVTHLLAREDGPADLIVRFRVRLGSSQAGRLMDCFNCLCVWIAAPAAFYVVQKPLDWVFVWLAVSGGACLLERAAPEPVVIQQLPPTTRGETDHGMLRPETSDAQGRPDDGSHTT